MAEIVQIDQIEEGMVLAEPIVNNFGQTLLPADIELSSKHVNILKTWNIRSVTVKGDATQEDFTLSEELRAKAKEHLAGRMKWEPRDKFEKELYKMGIVHVARYILNKSKD
ncbi:MAG: hypothetical protein ACOCX7_02180 [Bacteroidota bacterium]